MTANIPHLVSLTPISKKGNANNSENYNPIDISKNRDENNLENFNPIKIFPPYIKTANVAYEKKKESGI